MATTCTCSRHMTMRMPDPNCPIDHDRRVPLYQYTGTIDGKHINVDIEWGDGQPHMKWTSRDA